MNYKVTILIVVLLIGLGFAGVWYYFRQQPSTAEPTPVTEETQPTEEKETLATINPENYKSQLDDNFQIAKSKASEWLKSAQFVFLQVSISSDLNLKKVTETYVFQSPADKENLWTCNIDLEGNYLRAKIPKKDYLTDQKLSKISTKYWKINFIDAFQEAEQNGGKEFREKYKDELEIAANLGAFGPKNFLHWQIEYTSLTDEVETKTVLVDAYSGEMAEE